MGSKEVKLENFYKNSRGGVVCQLCKPVRKKPCPNVAAFGMHMRRYHAKVFATIPKKPKGGRTTKGSFEQYCIAEGDKHTCRLCNKEYSGRIAFLKHMRDSHEEEHQFAKGTNIENRNLTSKDIAVREDFKTYAKPSKPCDLEIRMFYAFQFNSKRMIPDFAYIKLDDNVSEANRDIDGQRKLTPDKELLYEYRLVKDDFNGLNKRGFNRGHYLARMFFFYSDDEIVRNAPNLCSIVGPQHIVVNNEYIAVLERAAVLLNSTNEVRIVAGNFGSTEIDLSLKMVVPSDWYYVIVIRDRVSRRFQYDSYVFPNADIKEPLQTYREEMEVIWTLSGFDFFAPIMDNMERFNIVKAAGIPIHLLLHFSRKQQDLQLQLQEEREKTYTLTKKLEVADKMIKFLCDAETHACVVSEERCMELEKENSKFKFLLQKLSSDSKAQLPGGWIKEEDEEEEWLKFVNNI